LSNFVESLYLDYQDFLPIIIVERMFAITELKGEKTWMKWNGS
jgi:hypothetical protein